jgi:hypothetical protein
MKPKNIGLSLLVGTAALVCVVSPAQAADKKPNGSPDFSELIRAGLPGMLPAGFGFHRRPSISGRDGGLDPERTETADTHCVNGGTKAEFSQVVEKIRTTKVQ